MNTSISISVVIPAHNRNNLLRNTLVSLLAQDFLNNQFEIIVVGYKENTTRTVIGEFNSPQIRYFEINSTWPDQKRNVGWKNASGDIIAFTDDDCIPQKNWLSKIMHAFETNPTAAGIEGKTTQDNKQLFYHATENLTGGKFPTCNLAIKKEWLERVNGFDENYHFFREDIDLAFKIFSVGGKIVFDPTVVVYHPPRKISWKTILRELSLVKNDIRLHKKFPKLHQIHFGFLCKGSWKQSATTWLLLSAGMFAAFLHLFLLLVPIVLVLLVFRYWVSCKGKLFSPAEFLLFTLACVLRDLAFPLYFIYYWISVRVDQS